VLILTTSVPADNMTFWQTTLGGAVIGAAIAGVFGIAGVAVTWLVTRRGEARAVRRDAGAKVIRTAYRLRDACNEVLAADAGRHSRIGSEARRVWEHRHDHWQAVQAEAVAEYHIAMALAHVDLAVVHFGLVNEADVWMLRYVNGLSPREIPLTERLDVLIEKMEDLLAMDSGARHGARKLTGSRQFENFSKKVPIEKNRLWDD